MFKAKNKVFKGSNKADKIFRNWFKFKKLKNNKFENSTYIKATEKSIFLIFGIGKAFIHLR